MVATEADGRERWIMVAGSAFPEEDEAALITQFLVDLACLERHASHREKVPVLELVSLDEPPSASSRSCVDADTIFHVVSAHEGLW